MDDQQELLEAVEDYHESVKKACKNFWHPFFDACLAEFQSQKEKNIKHCSCGEVCSVHGMETWKCPVIAKKSKEKPSK